MTAQSLLQNESVLQKPGSRSGILLWLLQLTLFALPLACWPNLDSSFSTPKLALITLCVLLLCTYLRCRRPLFTIDISTDWPLLFWLLSLSACTVLSRHAQLMPLLVALLPALLFLLRLAPFNPLRILWLASLLQSVVVLLQLASLDPLRLLGWLSDSFSSPRMRLYGTMGNPDFVAAWTAALLPVAYLSLLSPARNRFILLLRCLGLLLAFIALATTASRVVWLVLPLQSLFLLLVSARTTGLPGKLKWFMPAMPLIAMLLIFLLPLHQPVRSLQVTAQGRLYMDQITLANAHLVPFAGYGAGSYQARYAQWQLDQDSDASTSPFAGPTLHAHNDPLEFFVEYGWPGAVAFLAVCLWLAWRMVRALSSAAPAYWWAAAATLLSLLVISLVDFPFHRPAEWALFWAAAGILTFNGNPLTSTNTHER